MKLNYRSLETCNNLWLLYNFTRLCGLAGWERARFTVRKWNTRPRCKKGIRDAESEELYASARFLNEAEKPARQFMDTVLLVSADCLLG